MTGPFGADVAVGKPLTGGSGQELQVSLPKLTAGRYGVRWLAVAADTHRSTGQFSFQIVP